MKIKHVLYESEQEPILRVGHLEDRRNFTHVKDMVRAYWKAINLCEPGELYLVGSAREQDTHTFREVLEQLIELSTVSGIKYQTDQRYVRPTQVPFLICDPSKFCEKTSWQPELGFDRILTDTLEFWREQVGAGKVNSAA